jgi:nucleoside-diphosphate-sugar epimerase
MRVLVIGGMVFMGRDIVQRLVRRGHDVTVLHRRDHHDLGAGVHNAKADRGDLALMQRVLREGRFDAIFDLVYDWEKGTSAAQVEAAARHAGDQLQRYVFMSSIAAYGPGLDHRESDQLVPDDFPNPYARDKAASERALFRLHAETGVPVSTFRPPFVHGPRQPLYREQFFWDRLRAGRPIILPDGGAAPIQWAYVSDVAEACVRAMEVPEAAGEAFNIAHREKLTQLEYVELLARVAGVTPSFASIPRADILAAGGHAFVGNLYFGEFLDIPVHTEVVDKAPRMLAVTPRSIETSLADGYKWYLSQPARQIDYAFENRLLADATH